MTGLSVGGFDPSKISSLRIVDSDCKRLGIREDDFSKVDKDGDGIISSAEFLAGGLSYTSIFNAFKTMAVPLKGFSEKGKENNETENSNPISGVKPQFAQNNLRNKNSLFASQNNMSFSPSHPKIAGHQYLAQNMDYLG